VYFCVNEVISTRDCLFYAKNLEQKIICDSIAWIQTLKKGNYRWAEVLCPNLSLGKNMGEEGLC
jgi:hypothetical protein